MIFKVTIIRHAETDYNRQHLILSHSDGGLNETGIKQAELLGENLKNEKFTRAYSSDMSRTQQTAKGLFSKVNCQVPELVLDKNLRERSFGEWDGRPGKDIYVAAAKAGIPVREFNPPGSETYGEAVQRVMNFFQALCSECDNATEDENVLIVTHGLWKIFFFHYLYKVKDNLIEVENFDWSLEKDGPPSNTSVTQFTMTKCNAENGKRKIVFSKLTDVSHLDGLGCIKVNYNQ